MALITSRYTEAMEYARSAHGEQLRKGSNVPYIQHPIAVSCFVIEYGGNEDQAIAALLHDVLEDCSGTHEPVIRRRFGDTVADIVLACTDGISESKKAAINKGDAYTNWWERKKRYLSHLKDQPDEVLLISGCDKLHNAMTIVHDIERPELGLAVFDRFKSGRNGSLRYYHTVTQIFEARGCPFVPALQATVERMHTLAGAQERHGLFD